MVAGIYYLFKSLRRESSTYKDREEVCGKIKKLNIIHFRVPIHR